MKKIGLIFVLSLTALFLFGCGDKETQEIDYKVMEDRIEEALKQNEEKTNLKIMSSDKNEDGRHVITVDDDTMYFIEENKITLAMKPSAVEKKFASTILVGVADNDLSLGDRNLILNELGINYESEEMLNHTEVTENNNVKYTYKGKEDSIILQAEIN